MFINDDFQASQNLLVQASKKESSTKLEVRDTRTSPPFAAWTMIEAYEPLEIKLSVKKQIVVGKLVPFYVEYYHKDKLLKGFSNDLLTESQFEISKENSTSFIKAKLKGIGFVRANYLGIVKEASVNAVLPLKCLLHSSEILLPEGESFKLNVVGGSG